VSKPLQGVRVLDLSRILAGPFAGQTLADLGAEVVKVERPGAGDDTRSWGPPFVESVDGSDYKDAAYFLSTNRGKRSVTIDFTQPEGADLVLKLASSVDILIENFKTNGLRKYGLDYEGVRAVNPRIIYCSITGFGYSGPYRDRVGYDFLIQGMSGLMSITGESDEQPGGAPMKVGVAVSDLFTGLYAVTGILAALRHRDATGVGQHIDMALLDSQIGVLANQALNFMTTGNPPGRLGNAHPNIVPYQVFACSDGHIILAVGNDTQFRKFCTVAGVPDWPDDARFSNNAARVQNRDDMVALITPVIKTRTQGDWVESLQAAGVPCGPINDIAQMFDNEQVRARGMAVDIEHPKFGSVPSVRCPIRFSETPVEFDRAPPVLGADVDEVLQTWAGIDAERIGELRESGVL